MILAFTGHRPDKLGGWHPNPTRDAVRERIRTAMLELKPERIISGMALGVDQWAVEIALDLDVAVTAAVPFDGQELVWTDDGQRHYRSLMARVDRVVVVDPVRPNTRREAGRKLQRRNEWMVDHCDVLAAVWNGSDGGTANCVRYAERVGREVRMIWP